MSATDDSFALRVLRPAEASKREGVSAAEPVRQPLVVGLGWTEVRKA